MKGIQDELIVTAIFTTASPCHLIRGPRKHPVCREGEMIRMLVGEDQRPWSHRELIPQEIGAVPSGRLGKAKRRKAAPAGVVTKTHLQVEPL